MSQNDRFDPNFLGLSDTILRSVSASTKRPPRHRHGEAFLKGPVPWLWIEKAAQLPGKALHVGILLWQSAGCRKSRSVHFCLARAVSLGMHLNSARRALRRLAKAGLIEIHHRPGQGLEVTLLEHG
jgi:hypothetical protein